MNRSSSLTLLASIAAAVGLLTSGCAPSKEEAAVNRLKNLKRPGFARLVNFSSSEATFVMDGVPMTIKAAPESVSSPTPAGAGNRKFGAKVGEKIIDAGAIEVSTDQLVSIYLVPGNTATVVGTELRDPKTETPCFQVTVVGEGGPISVLEDKAVKVKDAAAGTTSEPVETDEMLKSLTVVDAAGKVLAKVQTKIEAKCSYTLAVYLSKGKAKAFFIKNTPVRKPSGTSGFSAA